MFTAYFAFHHCDVLIIHFNHKIFKKKLHFLNVLRLTDSDFFFFGVNAIINLWFIANLKAL